MTRHFRSIPCAPPDLNLLSLPRSTLLSALANSRPQLLLPPILMYCIASPILSPKGPGNQRSSDNGPQLHWLGLHTFFALRAAKVGSASWSDIDRKKSKRPAIVLKTRYKSLWLSICFVCKAVLLLEQKGSHTLGTPLRTDLLLIRNAPLSKMMFYGSNHLVNTSPDACVVAATIY
jgi:hypothetical protein